MVASQSERRNDSLGAPPSSLQLGVNGVGYGSGVLVGPAIVKSNDCVRVRNAVVYVFKSLDASREEVCGRDDGWEGRVVVSIPLDRR